MQSRVDNARPKHGRSEWAHASKSSCNEYTPAQNVRSHFELRRSQSRLHILIESLVSVSVAVHSEGFLSSLLLLLFKPNERKKRKKRKLQNKRKMTNWPHMRMRHTRAALAVRRRLGTFGTRTRAKLETRSFRGPFFAMMTTDWQRDWWSCAPISGFASTKKKVTRCEESRQ